MSERRPLQKYLCLCCPSTVPRKCGLWEICYSARNVQMGSRCCLCLDFTLTVTVPLSTKLYKWVLVNLILGVTLRWTSIKELEVLILLVASCYRNWIKSGLMGHLARLQTYQEMSKTIPLPWTTKTLLHVHVT